MARASAARNRSVRLLRLGCRPRESLRVAEGLVRGATQTDARRSRQDTQTTCWLPVWLPGEGRMSGPAASGTCWSDLTCEDYRAGTNWMATSHSMHARSQRSFFKITKCL